MAKDAVMVDAKNRIPRDLPEGVQLYRI